MKKNLICVMAVLIALALSSCSTKQEETVKKATDNKGNCYSAYVDGDGFLEIDEKGSLVVDENGKEASVDFPPLLTVGNEIHTKFFKLEIPGGWLDGSDELAKIKYDSGGISAELVINERSSSTKMCRDEIESIMSPMKNELKNVKLDFALATKLEYEGNVNFYIFSIDGRTYFIRTTLRGDSDEKINFEEIINTIQFRKGE